MADASRDKSVSYLLICHEHASLGELATAGCIEQDWVYCTLIQHERNEILEAHPCANRTNIGLRPGFLHPVADGTVCVRDSSELCNRKIGTYSFWGRFLA